MIIGCLIDFIFINHRTSNPDFVALMPLAVGAVNACRRANSLPSSPYPAIIPTSITPTVPTTMALPTNLPSNFQSTFNDALRAYKKRTREDLFLHPLAARMQSCDSPSAILYVLREQVRNDEEKWTNWLSPVVSAIHTLSLTLGEDVGLVIIVEDYSFRAWDLASFLSSYRLGKSSLLPLVSCSR